jgi:Ca2+-binding EF-hand superfamily protein
MEDSMRILKLSLLLTFAVAVTPQLADAQPPAPQRNEREKIGDTGVADVLQRLGAKLEQGISARQLDDYANHFDRADPNRDGKHTKEEFVEKGFYMTPQARAGIFRAADSNADGVVAKPEYILNRIITDEGKAIVQGMDDDQDGVVERAEFVKHATQLLSNDQLAEQVFAALDTNADGVIPIPEYLRVWGRWARADGKTAVERIAAVTREDRTSPDSQSRRPGGQRPGGGAGPPSVDVVFERFDVNKDGKLQQDEIPKFAQQFILPADTNGDDEVTKKELQESRDRRPPGTRPSESNPQQPNR